MTSTPVYTVNIKSLKDWKTAVLYPNKEPYLEINLHDGTRLQIMMPSHTASELGKALQKLGEELQGNSKPN